MEHPNSGQPVLVLPEMPYSIQDACKVLANRIMGLRDNGSRRTGETRYALDKVLSLKPPKPALRSYTQLKLRGHLAAKNQFNSPSRCSGSSPR